jgi:hypothetical protein
MKSWTVVATILVLFTLSSCSRVQVSQDYRIGTNFSQYHTFQWKTSDSPTSDDIRVNNPLLHERFRQAIENRLSASGYVLQSRADFLVNYSYSIQSRLESEPYGTNVGFGFGRQYRYGEIGFGNGVSVTQYDVGILAIDIYDALNGTLLWRGTGSEIVRTHSTPEETTAFVYRMVDSILAQFPPL